mgnify:CR=1 FL=1
MSRLPLIIVLTGIALITYGYWQLAVPPDAGYQELLDRARNGVFSVVAGSTCIMLWLARR